MSWLIRDSKLKENILVLRKALHLIKHFYMTLLARTNSLSTDLSPCCPTVSSNHPQSLNPELQRQRLAVRMPTVLSCSEGSTYSAIIMVRVLQHCSLPCSPAEASGHSEVRLFGNSEEMQNSRLDRWREAN